MSSTETPTQDLERSQKRRIQRRHGACEPCRSSKTKCDGRIPCGACRSERRRQSPCKYSEKAMKLQQVAAEIRRQAESSETKSTDIAIKRFSEDEAVPAPLDGLHHQETRTPPAQDKAENLTLQPRKEQPECEREAKAAKMSRSISVCAVVEEFKRLKPARGYSVQVVSRCRGLEALQEKTVETQRKEMARTLLVSSESSPSPPQSSELPPESLEMQSIKARLKRIDNLIQDGYLDYAWDDLPAVVRHVDRVSSLTSDAASPASKSWGTLRNEVLDLESQLCLTIGQPPCMNLARGHRPQTDHDVGLLKEESLDVTRTDLYQRIQGVLTLDLSNSTVIRDFLERAEDVLHHEPFEQVGLCTTDEHPASARDLQLNTHLLFMVIYCRMASLCDLFSRDLTNGSWVETPAADIIRSMNLQQPRQKLTYCRKMFRSANFILQAFVSLHQADAKQTGRSWIRCHSAYVAATILGIAKLRHEVEWHATSETLTKMEQIFLALSRTNPQCQLFRIAVDRLRDLGSVKEPASEAARNKHSGIKHRKRSATNSVETSPRIERRAQDSRLMTMSMSPRPAPKRGIEMVDEPVTDNHIQRGKYIPIHIQEEGEEGFQTHSTAGTSLSDLQMDPLNFFQDNSATYSQSDCSFVNASAPSTVTSFSETDMPLPAVSEAPIGHPGPPFAFPFPYEVLHPPMTWNNSIYPVNEASNPNLSLRIPSAPQFGQSASPLSCHAVSTPPFGLHQTEDGLNADTAGLTAIQASPLRLASDRALQTQDGPTFQQTSPVSAGVGAMRIDRPKVPHFTHPADKSLQDDTLSRDPRRPSLDRRRSANTAQQSPQPTPKYSRPPQSLVSWSIASSAVPGQNVPSSMVGTTLGAPDSGRRASLNDARHPELIRASRDAEPAFFGNTAVSQPHDLLADQLFPHGQMPFSSPAAKILEQGQAQAQYSQCQAASYGRFYPGQDLGQYLGPWRRQSIDAGGSSSTRF